MRQVNLSASSSLSYYGNNELVETILNPIIDEMSELSHYDGYKAIFIVSFFLFQVLPETSSHHNVLSSQRCYQITIL